MVHSPPEPITARALDTYLERGWFRFGGTMRTTRFTVWEERHLRSTIWTRTDVDHLRWSKSNRRALNRVRKNYTIDVHPLALTEEHEALYQRYCAFVGGERPATLVDFLGGEDAVDCYDTLQISIRQGRDLAAFSLFDAGDTSLMSLLGAFDPSFAKDSLGMASMLLEVEFARETGRSYHYSGYVLPGEPRMDYKLRVGAMEFLHPDHTVWQPIEALEHTVLPDERMRNALDRIGRGLGRAGVRCRRMLNPLFELADSPVIPEPMIAEPMLVMVNSRTEPFPIVTWDDHQREYQLWTGQPAVIRHRRSWDGPERATGTALIDAAEGRFSTAADVREAVMGLLEARRSGRPSPKR
jgi:arginyl-tRNA--protein-N-Asp/Glu arginylyltransferase